MTPRLRGRRRAVAQLLVDLEVWARSHHAVRAVLVVGSYARGAERMASDVDVMILTPVPDELARSDWFEAIRPGARLVRAKSWGPVRERRYRLRSGLLAELGIAPLSWAAVPLDPGTRRVLTDGYRIVYDNGVLDGARSVLTPRAPGGLCRD